MVKIDIAGIVAAIIVLGTVAIAGGTMGLLILISMKSIEYGTLNCDIVGAGMTETEIAVYVFLGAAVWVIIFLRELGKGNIQ